MPNRTPVDLEHECLRHFLHLETAVPRCAEKLGRLHGLANGSNVMEATD